MKESKIQQNKIDKIEIQANKRTEKNAVGQIDEIK